MPKLISIVAEDKLTEAVLSKCVKEYLPDAQVVRSEVKGGRGNVQRELPAYISLSKVMPVLIGVDLDGDQCPPTLLQAWGIAGKPHGGLLVRVAVREIESWVLADRKRFAKFIDAVSDDIPKNPDSLEDPKHFLLGLARETADTALKRDLVPRNFGQHPRIGRAYNPRMCDFVHAKWRPKVAVGRSDSLRRAIAAITAL